MQKATKEVIRKCRKSVIFFVENFCKIKHPTIGILPFELFAYQKSCLKSFRENRFNIFKKCRQSGISTLCGAYALWTAMFFNDKTILIVSKTDEDAKTFLNKNVKFIYDNLPKWIRKIWKTPIRNEHQFGFNNGSIIKSLTSAPNALRSNASSLNIIDEAAFISDMETMWSGGWSTLQHGGHVIVVSTPFGLGGWYWKTWADAIEKQNDFNPIVINWYDMDWALEYTDPITNKKMRIAPTDGLRKCKTKEEIEKYGEYWSPWLEGEYRGLQQRGKSHLFKQEVLAEFLGSGGTILSRSTLTDLKKQVDTSPQPKIVTELQPHIHPITGETEYIDFNGPSDDEGLWIWEEPIRPTQNTMRNGRVVKHGKRGHPYVVGVDVATGKNEDYSAIQVFDIATMDQVAEYMGRPTCIPYAKIVDFIGRWYNNALVIIESTGVGNPFIQNIEELAYPNLWRRKKRTKSGVSYGPIGFPTSETGKNTLNKNLIDYLSGDAGFNYTIHSQRLLSQLQTYIRKRTKSGQDTQKTGAQTGSHDDLVIATALALQGIDDAADDDQLVPLSANLSTPNAPQLSTLAERTQMQQNIIKNNDPNFLMPLNSGNFSGGAPSVEEQLSSFTSQITNGAKTNGEATKMKRNYFSFNK